MARDVCSSGPRLGMERILSPRSVAVVGASASLDKFGDRVLHHLQKHGFTGRLLPINPNRADVRGLPAFRSLADAPGPIDVAVIAVPPARVLAAIEEAAAAAVGCCVVITAQLAEAGVDGAVRQDRAVAVARAAGMRLLGPNCLGLVNVPAGVALTASFAMAVDRLQAGRVGVISQSGALMATMLNFGHDVGIGFSVLVSVGNQADVTENELFRHLIEDEATAAILLYVEGLSDAAAFLALAERARERGKPVVLVKAGRSEGGARAAFSHTASLAGPHRLLAAAARARGVVLVDDPEAAVACADALARWPARPAAGRPMRIAAASGSGGGAAILADRLADAGFALAEPAPAVRAGLVAWLAPDQPLQPLDIGALGEGFGLEATRSALPALLHDPGTDALLYLMTTQPLMPEIADELARLARGAKPVLLVLSAGSVADPVRRRLRELELPFANRLDDALRVLRSLADHAAPPAPRAPAPATPELVRLAGRLGPGRHALPELEPLLRAAGLGLPPGVPARSAEEAVAAMLRLGPPVVLKVLAPEAVHKSDRGGVVPDLQDAAAVTEAWDRMEARFGAPLAGALVQKQAPAGTELILGSLWDDGLGPFVLVGSGGIFAELFADTTVVPAPVAEGEAHDLLRRLRVWPVLAGARGRPAADVAATVAAVAAVGRLAAALGPRLLELDINPLIVGSAGLGAVAVDARARLR